MALRDIMKQVLDANMPDEVTDPILEGLKYLDSAGLIEPDHVQVHDFSWIEAAGLYPKISMSAWRAIYDAIKICIEENEQGMI